MTDRPLDDDGARDVSSTDGEGGEPDRYSADPDADVLEPDDELDAENDDYSDSEEDSEDDDDLDLDPDEFEMRAAQRKFQREQREAWGSWKQDRELNRRKVKRALISLVVVAVLTGFLAYGCDALRGPREVRLADKVSGYTLQPPTPETDQLAGALQADGAVGPAARYYRGPGGEVLLIAGYSTDIPTDVVGQLLPPLTSADDDYTGHGGAVTCGATAQGARCLWKSSDLVAGTSARGMTPDALATITRKLRTDAIR